MQVKAMPLLGEPTHISMSSPYRVSGIGENWRPALRKRSRIGRLLCALSIVSTLRQNGLLGRDALYVEFLVGSILLASYLRP
jgi:hypothetical protein